MRIPCAVIRQLLCYNEKALPLVTLTLLWVLGHCRQLVAQRRIGVSVVDLGVCTSTN